MGFHGEGSCYGFPQVNGKRKTSMDAILCSIPEAAKALGLGRSKTYELIAAGQLVTVTIGRRRLVRIESIKAFAEKLEA